MEVNLAGEHSFNEIFLPSEKTGMQSIAFFSKHALLRDGAESAGGCNAKPLKKGDIKQVQLGIGNKAWVEKCEI